MRKPISHAFAMSTLMEYEPYVDLTSIFFTSRLASLYAATGKICDLGEWLQFYAFDVVGEITYSKRLGFLEQAKDVDGIIKSIDEAFDYSSSVCCPLSLYNRSQLTLYMGKLQVGQMPWLDPLLKKNPIWNYFNPSTSAVTTFTLSCMAERMDDLEPGKMPDTMKSINSRKGDMLSRMIIAHQNNPKKVSLAHILGWATSNTYAGSDTVAISLRTLFYYLLKNPSSMAKLLHEIDTFEGLSNPVSWNDTKKMPYLNVCMKEALRINPAPAMLLERVIPKGGRDICGRFFEEGTIVGINPWVIQRDKVVFGDDAEQWRPERWEEASEEGKKRMDRAFLAVCFSLYIPSKRGMHMADILRYIYIESSGAEAALALGEISPIWRCVRLSHSC